jgi:hypothetical protein
MDGSKDLQSNRHSLTGLLAAIEAEFSDHIMPNLPADQNFRKAMIRRALHILIRQLDIDKTAQTELAQKTAMADCTELATALRNAGQLC